MLHAYLTQRSPGFMQEGGRVLHFAPELQTALMLQQRSGLQPIYCDISLDGSDWGKYWVNMRPWILQDAQDLALADGSVDGIISVHVLEHVPDDAKALREMLRVLRPGGTAVIMVPFDPHISATEEWGAPNAALFDHYRNYCADDFMDRLHDFEWERITPSDLFDAEELDRFQIRPMEIVYVCRKPAS